MTVILADTKSYDWNEHAKEADVEIGEIDKDGSVIFYDQLTQNDIMELYSPVYYKVISASASYAEFNDGKREGKIYAVSTHPQLTEADLSPENFIIPGVPFLVEIDNDKVINYYFDDKEIIDFLDSDTNALDSYWNLD